MKMFRFKLYYWPGFTCAWFTVTFFISYLTSVLSGNVYWFFPFISDMGAYPPESCIFGQFLNLGGLIMGICLYIRYRQIKFAIDEHIIDTKQAWNTATLVLAMISSLGISVVGNFQETLNLTMHLIGALMAFVIGSIYLIIQTRISYDFLKLTKISSRNGISRSVFYLRVFLSSFLLPLVVIFLVFFRLSMQQFTGKTVVYWTEEDGGFQLRLIATFSEWILVFFLLIYVATFTNEFKSLEFKQIEIISKTFN